MADTYIDYQEMEIYGDHAILALAKLAPLNPGVAVLTKRLSERVSAVRGAREAQRDTTDAGGGEREDRDALQGRLVRSLRSLKSHLESINNDEDTADVDVTHFFAGGVLGDLTNRTPAQALLKAEYALAGFSKSEDFSQKAEKRAKLEQLINGLRAAIGQTSEARPKEATASTELQRAGDAWRREYRGLKWVVWGLLILEDRENEYASYFKDETAGGRPSALEAIAPAAPEPAAPA